MSDPVTIQQLIDAGLDVDTIEQVTMNNGYTGDTTTNRDGVTIDTLEGRLKRLGFDVPIAYAGAISFAANERTKTISYSGNIYAPRIEDLPFTTSGTWVADDEDKFYSVQLAQVPLNAVDTANIVDEAVTTAKLDTTLQGKITNVGNLVTLSGVAADSTGLGTFTGSTIPDDSTNKEALQALETQVDANKSAILNAATFVNWTSASQLGSDLNISGAGQPALAALSSTDVAFADDGIGELRTYRFNGSTWSLIGSGLAIPSINGPALAALSDTDVAFIDNGNDELRTYRFNGSTWSQIGSGLSISGIGGAALTALSSTDVAFIDSNLEELRVYRFNGSTWSLVGSGLSISGIGLPSLTALNATDVAFIDDTNDELRTYRFNGSTWSLVGSGLSLSIGLGNIVLASLNAYDVALYRGSSSGEFRTYRFDGSDWAQVGSSLTVSGGTPSMAAINGSNIAFIDSTGEDLRTYRFGFSMGELPHSRQITG